MSKLKLLLAITGLIFTWMLVVPIFEFPDEQAHFETIEFVKDQNRLPMGQEHDMTREMGKTQELLGVFRNPQGQNKYTYHPEYRPEYTDNYLGKYEAEIKALNTTPNRSTYVGHEAARYPALYYRYMGLFQNLVEDHDIMTRIFVTRLGGLLIALALGLTLYLLGKEIFKDEMLARALAVITMIQPMFSFVTAGINSDNLHNLAFTLIIYLCVYIINHGVTFYSFLFLIGVTAVDIYAKPQGLIAPFLIAFALILLSIKKKEYKILGYLALFLIPVGLFGHREFFKYFGFFTLESSQGSSLIEYIRFSLNKLVAQNVVWYWGVFKWLGVVLPPIYWRLANRLVLVSAIGILAYFYKLVKKKSTVADPFIVIYLIVVSLAYAVAIFWFDFQYVRSVGFSLGIQARYFFPTIATHLAILLVGLTSLVSRAKHRQMIIRAVILFFILLQLGGIWRLITSYYDTSSLNALITQMSQYKPEFAKGEWWYLWGSLYLGSVLYLLKTLQLPRKNRSKMQS